MRLLVLFLAGMSLTTGRTVPFLEQNSQTWVTGNKMLSRCDSVTDKTTNQIIRSISAQFAVSAFQAITRTSVEASANVLISPSSIATALGMVYAGARNKTAEEIKYAFGLSEYSETQILCILGTLFRSMKNGEISDLFLEAANRVYVANGYNLANSFRSKLEENFKATAKSVNFDNSATRFEINQWVEESTRGKIKELIPDGHLDASTRLVLVNAVYFKGSWLSKFEPDATTVEPFHLGSGKGAVQIPLMNAYGSFRNVRVSSINARALELPYAGEELSMIILLPDETDGLRRLESQINGSVITDTLRMLEASEFDIDIAIPQFKIESSLELTSPLEELGINSLFNDAADLSGMLETLDNLQVSDVFHKTFIEVNEEGTEAAAATGFPMGQSSEPFDGLPPFRADHPFIFFIIDKLTESVLFLGRFANPQAPAIHMNGIADQNS